VEDLPLLELFTRLREAGLPIGVAEYQLALRALQDGFGVGDRQALARLCRTLWVKSPDEEQIFSYHFDQFINSVPSPPTASEAVTPASTRTNRRKQILLYSAIGTTLLVGIGVLTHHQFFNNQPNPSPPITPAQPSASPTENSTPTPSATPLPIPSASPDVVATPSTGANRNLLQSLWVEIAVLAVFSGLTGVWIARQRASRQQKSDRISKPSVSLTGNAVLSSQLIKEVGDEIRVAQVVRRATTMGDQWMGDRLLTGTDFFPITRRQMKQSWRYLRRLVREGAPTELDVDATIDQIGRHGLLLNPVLIPRRVNRTELVLLIDQDGSMVPFHSLSQRLVETAVQGGRLGETEVYYFHNCPTDYVYHDPSHQQAVLIDDFLNQLHKSRTVILIFSDAGAARGGNNSRRRRLTKTFINDLKQHVRYVAWLNPMPRSRWTDTTAAEIAHLVPMFEISRQGLDRAIEVLRGRHAYTEESTTLT
jgi:uncharacterized protein with von Willebrand factor type A (vWA) domain